eukprot:4523714-Prymnesium_polylepis.1
METPIECKSSTSTVEEDKSTRRSAERRLSVQALSPNMNRSMRRMSTLFHSGSTPKSRAASSPGSRRFSVASLGKM